MGSVISLDFETNAVRMAMHEGEPVWVAADVCRLIEVAKYRDAVAQLDDDERVSVLVDTLGGRQTMSAVNESGLYALIMMSRKPAAKRFRKWVTSEVLPTIRRHGSYKMPAPAVDPFEAMAGRTGHVRDQLAAIAAMPDFAREVTHLPIWKNGRRPDWWGNYDLRTFLTESHRQMTLAACCAEVKRRFNRPFSTTTLQRYWALLDQAIGPKTKKEAA